MLKSNLSNISASLKSYQKAKHYTWNRFLELWKVLLFFSVLIVRFTVEIWCSHYEVICQECVLVCIWLATGALCLFGKDWAGLNCLLDDLAFSCRSCLRRRTGLVQTNVGAAFFTQGWSRSECDLSMATEISEADVSWPNTTKTVCASLLSLHFSIKQSRKLHFDKCCAPYV